MYDAIFKTILSIEYLARPKLHFQKLIAFTSKEIIKYASAFEIDSTFQNLGTAMNCYAT